MKCDDTITPNVPEIKINSPSSSPRDQVINTTSEGRGSSSSNSSGSSLSDLRKRLQGLPSPNEFTLLADRVAALGRQICRKRELFLRLHGVADRIEENDEWEAREQRDRSESSLRAFRSKDARARRRARVRLESSSRDDKTMMIPQSGGPTGSAKVVDDDTSNSAVSSADRSAHDCDYLRLPAIEISRGQLRQSSLSEPSSTRFSQRNSGGWCDFGNGAPFRSYRDFAPRDNAPRSIDLPSVSPFALSNVRPKKFGGYRPPSGVILKNLSSSSGSESVNEENRELSSARRGGSTIATVELSSPESKDIINESIKKMSIVSARSGITRSILPNLPSPTRSLCEDNHSRIYQDTDVDNERASRDELLTIISNERQLKSEYENTPDEKEQMPQSTFSARSFTSESVERVTRIYNKRAFACHDGPVLKISNEQLESECEDKHDEKERIESYRSWSMAKIYREDIEDHQFSFNRPRNRSDNNFCKNIEINSLRNPDKEVLDGRETVDSPYLDERIRNDATEEALSSQTSEPFGSEDHSRSSCIPKIRVQMETLSQREMLSSTRIQNDSDVSDKRDQEIITVTSVPTLALNSQDISYSTSAGSRECSAMRPLDPHALIKALSDVSLKQGKRDKSASRKCEDIYRQREDTIDISRGASDFLTKGETWRVPSSSESPRKTLSRVPSRIPVMISSGNKLSGYRKSSENSNEIENHEESKFINQNGVQTEVSDNIVHQLSEISYSQNCKQASVLRSRNNSIEVTIVTDHSGLFAPDDEVTGYESNDYEPASLTSSSLQSPQITPFGDRIYREMPESRPSGKSGPHVFLNEAAYPSDRDFSKIDDDVRSDRSTSRKSAETVDVTSATESPYLSEYKNNSISRNQSLQIESSRNADKNLTWRTEDERASINDEENPEDAQDENYYESYSKKSDFPHLQTKERSKTVVEGTYDLSPHKTQPLRADSLSEHEEISRKQRVSDDLEFHDKSRLDQSVEPTKIARSENLMLQTRKTDEISRADYQSPDKDFCRTKMDDELKEKTVHQLKTHPSITRLAAVGLEDTVTEILCCVAQDQMVNESSWKFGMKKLARIFSSKLRRTPKQRSDVEISEPAKVIYENRVCQAESRANSCSGDSSAEETHRMNLNKTLNNCWIARHTAESNPILVSDGNILKKTESLEAIPRESPAKNRYPIFIAKNLQYSDKLSESNIEHGNPLKGQQRDVPISDHVVPSVSKKEEKSKKGIYRKADANFVPEVEEIEDLTGCFCLRLCRLIGLSKYRLSIKEQAPSTRMKKSSSLLRKRRK